jgi:hypothetical protein
MTIFYFSKFSQNLAKLAEILLQRKKERKGQKRKKKKIPLFFWSKYT